VGSARQWHNVRAQWKIKPDGWGPPVSLSLPEFINESVCYRRSRIERIACVHVDGSAGDLISAEPWLRRRRGGRIAHLGGSGGRAGGADRRRRLRQRSWPSSTCWGGLNQRRRSRLLPRRGTDGVELSRAILGTGQRAKRKA